MAIDVTKQLRIQMERSGVVKKGHFKLASGRHSDTYINKDAIYSDPILFHNIVDRLIIGMPPCDVITGPAVAGAVLAAPVAVAMGKIFVYPEKVDVTRYGDQDYPNPRPDYRMMLRRGYDKIVADKKVVLIEDIITTGGSVKEAINCIVAVGADVVGVRCIWNRGGIKDFTYDVATGDPKGHSDGYYTRHVPIVSIINDPVWSYHADECPLCRELENCPKCDGLGTEGCECRTGAMPGKVFKHPALTNPKTGEVIPTRMGSDA